MLNLNTYQIKWYPDSLFDLFVVNLKAYFSPLLLFYRLNTAYCVDVLVCLLNTASVFDLFSDLPKEELPMTGRDGQQYQWQKSHNVLSLRPAEDKERHDPISETQTTKTAWWTQHGLYDVLAIVTYGFADVTKGIDVLKVNSYIFCHILSYK